MLCFFEALKRGFRWRLFPSCTERRSFWISDLLSRLPFLFFPPPATSDWKFYLVRGFSLPQSHPGPPRLPSGHLFFSPPPCVPNKAGSKVHREHSVYFFPPPLDGRRLSPKRLVWYCGTSGFIFVEIPQGKLKTRRSPPQPLEGNISGCAVSRFFFLVRISGCPQLFFGMFPLTTTLSIPKRLEVYSKLYGSVFRPPFFNHRLNCHRALTPPPLPTGMGALSKGFPGSSSRWSLVSEQPTSI